MSLYTDLVTSIKTLAEADPLVESVRKGLLIEVDKNIPMPSVHIRVTQATPNTQTMTFTVEIFAMALRGHDSTPKVDRFAGSYNEDTNLDNMLDVVYRMYLKLDKISEQLRVLGTPTFEPFYDSYMNNLDGWLGTFQIEIENDISLC